MNSEMDNAQDQLDGVMVFIKVVQLGSFARAAESIGLTRSAIGKSIARMESRLGIRLFHRTTRSQMLTDEGHIYYEHCLRALAELNAAKNHIESGRTEVAGRLRISMPVLFGRLCVAPILLEYARQYPKLELQMNFSDQHVDLITDGYDLAIRNGVLGHESDGLRARKLAVQRKVVCASPDYLSQYGTPEKPADLKSHSILLYQRGERIHTWQFKNESGQLFDLPLASRLIMNDLEVIADAAVAGMGLAWLPEWLIRDQLSQGQLVTTLDEFSGAGMACHAVWPDVSPLPLRVRLAIDTLLEKLPKTIA